ncbi:guanylate kinase-related [Holotrichia oblita]|nr:guanylate kinase-related [Holotrichia oblita]
MSGEGLLIVISGFSGAGKGTVVKKLVEEYQYKISVSATTRSPRQGEEHGREYFFLTRKEFESMIEENSLIEWAEYVGNYYGTPKDYVTKELESGNNVILEIEIQGALKVKEQYPEAILMFISPPSASCLEERLIGRGTEDEEIIKKRMARSCEEAIYMKDYDYIVLNDKLDLCVEKEKFNMLHPSYTDLMAVVNSEVEPGEQKVVNSRYSIVLATSKRARQIIDQGKPMVHSKYQKPLSCAIEELYQSKVKIIGDEEE